MANEAVTEWTLDGVLDELARIHSTMRDRQFAFILGSGASFTSGIPTGYDLAQRWIKDLYLRECADQRSINEWMADCSIGDGTLTLESVAEYYPQIFEHRFDGDREAGYAELEAAMEGKSPSLGYSLLAEIIQRTRHKVIVTTNFDNLVADALAMHAHQSPLVVAHESLAGFVRPQLRRPLVAKIHRDLFLQPINDVAGVSTMEKGWRIALKKLFQYFTPVVVGYGGNDGSLMDMLAELNEGDIAGRMVWCYREGSRPPQKALAVLQKHKGLLVKIVGFDEFMLQLAAKLVDDFDVAAIAERTAKLGQDRAERYREQASKLHEASARGSAEKQKAGTVMSESVRSGKSWWSWEMQSRSAANPEERSRIYLEGLQLFPGSAELTSSYAIFLAQQHKDYDAAESMFKKAIELDRSNATHAGNYAIFLAQQRKDYDAAETMYKRALELAPNDAIHARNYAIFLAQHRKDYDAAESMFKKAIEFDPNDATHTRSYAIFLAQQRKDYDAAETMYKKAIELDPSHANNIGNYANFLADQRKDYDAAELMFKKAIELDPGHANNVGNYANFLADQRKDYNAAESMYKKALELDPSHANNTNNYANFLADQREDYDAAEGMFKKAIELDPSQANSTGSYAIFLAHQRRDYDAAESMFKKALALDPGDANTIVNFASLLLTLGGAVSLREVVPLVERMLELSRPAVSQTVAEGLLYGALVNELLPGAQLDAMLGRLKGALLLDYSRERWDFSPMLAAVLPRLPAPRRDLFRALAEAVLNKEHLLALDSIEAWHEVQTIDPFAD